MILEGSTKRFLAEDMDKDEIGSTQGVFIVRRFGRD